MAEHNDRKFTVADVNRVALKILSIVGSAIVDIETFMRAYRSYAEDSYLKPSINYVANIEDGSYLEGSDPDNFCSNVMLRVFNIRGLNPENYIDQSKRETSEFEKAANEPAAK